MRRSRRTGLLEIWTPWPVSHFEMFLLVLIVLAVPFDNWFTAVGRFTFAFLFFALLGIYELVRRPKELARLATLPPALLLYLFLGLAAAAEMANLGGSTKVLVQTGQMGLGALVIASACRTQLALRALLHAVIGGAIVASAVVIPLTFGSYAELEQADRAEAERTRSELIDETSLDNSLNLLGISTAIGGVVAIGFMITARTSRHRVTYGMLALPPLVGAALTASRGAIVAAGVATAVGVLTAGTRGWLRSVATAGLVAGLLVILLPAGVFGRFTEDEDREQEPRAYLLEQVQQTAGDWAVIGVGAGNYYNDWGFDNGFKTPFETHVRGTHNAFTQVAVMWGVPALLAFVALLTILAVAVVGRRARHLTDRVPLMMLFAATVVRMMFTHDIEDKVFSLTIGVALAISVWMARDPEPDEVAPNRAVRVTGR